MFLDLLEQCASKIIFRTYLFYCMDFSGNIFFSAPRPAKKSLAIETRPLRAS